MGIPYPRAIGAHIKCKDGIVRNAGSAGTTDGVAIDRQAVGGNAMSCTLYVMKEATTGSPDSQTFDASIIHCATSGGSYAAYTDPSTGATAAITQDTTAVAASTELDVDLSGANQYIKSRVIVAHVNGTSPKTPFVTMVVLGGFVTEPV